MKKRKTKIIKKRKSSTRIHRFFLTAVLVLAIVVLPVAGIEFVYTIISNTAKKTPKPNLQIKRPCIDKDCIASSSGELLNTKIFVLPTVFSYPNQTVAPSPSPTSVPTKTGPTPSLGYCLNVPVLFYHHVQPYSLAKTKGQTALSVDNGAFDNQMAYLASHGYNTITAEKLVTALISKVFLPPKSIVVTFDDGYRDAYEYAFPIIKKYNITANFMIPTGLIGGADYLSWSQLEEMSKNPLVYITNHTWSHYSLPAGNAAKIHMEIETASTQLEQHLGKKSNVFTYPYGTFNSLAIQILKDNGYIGAFTTLPGTLQCDSYIMTLHRTRIGNASLAYYGL